MTDIQTQPVEASLEESEIEHIACCLDAVGSVEPSLCGQNVAECCEEHIDDVPADMVCVVCHDLDAADWCPRLGHCPYGAGCDAN